MSSTGALSRRSTRRSDLLFHWRSSGPGVDSVSGLDALTGQVGTFTLITPGTAGLVSGRNGVTVSAGKSMPRFVQVVGEGSGYGVPVQTPVTRLALTGDVAGQDIERVQWPHTLGVMALSTYLRVWPGYTPGQDLLGVNAGRFALSLGNDTTGGGALALRRINATWQVFRQRAAATLSSVFTEPGAVAFPIDLLVTLSAGGTLTLFSRDALGVLRDGPPATDANMMIGTEFWAGNLLYSGGGNYRIEEIKVARGVQSFIQMDLLI